MAIRPHLVTFSVPVDDLDAAADFYRQLLGKEPVEPTPGKLEFELVNGAWLQLNSDPDESGKPGRPGLPGKAATGMHSRRGPIIAPTPATAALAPAAAAQ